MKQIPRRTFLKLGTIGSMGLVLGCGGDRNFDVVIRHGLVYDGSGAAPVRADIGIRGKRIIAIGDLSHTAGAREIDARGMAVSPGFIDIHTHTDTELLVDPRGLSKVHQGVTLEVSGNCGSSPFPLLPDEARTYHARLMDKYGLDTDWRDSGGFLSALEKRGVGIHYATLTGHGDLRAYVVGKHDVPPTPGQIREMQSVLSRSMEMGSFGLSTGLEYAPGSYAKTAELSALSEVVARGGGFYATHMRNEDDRVEEAIAEALQIGREADVPVQISHLKACNRDNWHKVDHMLAMVGEARSRQPVLADRYPYDAWGTGLSAFLPLWARQGDTDEVLARLDDADELSRIREYTESRANRIGGWDRVLISGCDREADKVCEGKTVEEGARERGLQPFDYVRQLLKDNRNRVGVVGFAMDEANLHKVLAAEFVMIGSDGNAVSPTGPLGEGKPHPRYYGTFPRVLGKYVREEKVLKLADAIRKMTSMAADVLGLPDRGRIGIGTYADLVVFNPATVADRATFAEPHQFPAGIHTVLVNGIPAISKGEHTGQINGEVLRHSS